MSFFLTNNGVREAHRAANSGHGSAQKTGNKVGIAIGTLIEKTEENLGCRAQKQTTNKQESDADLVDLLFNKFKRTKDQKVNKALLAELGTYFPNNGAKKS